MSEGQTLAEKIANGLEQFADALERGDEICMDRLRKAREDIASGRTRPIEDVIAELAARSVERTRERLEP